MTPKKTADRLELTLAYGRQSPWRTRKRILRALLIGCTVVVLAAGLYWHRRIIDAIVLQYSQWQCLSFSRPADQVAFEEDLVAGATLPTLDLAYQKIENDYRRGSFYGFVFKPLDVVLSSPGNSSDAWLTASEVNPLLFLHERTSPAGHRRLVVVTVCYHDMFTAESIIPTGWFGSPASWTYSSGAAWMVNHNYEQLDSPGSADKPDEKARYFFGQIDPQDPSHFTIRYQVQDQEGLLDGWLCDNEAVFIRPRYGPWMQSEAEYDSWAARIGFDYPAALKDLGISRPATQVGP